jgi:hypothetical protein
LTNASRAGCGPEGFVLETENALGESLRVAIVTAGDKKPLTANEVLAARHIA